VGYLAEQQILKMEEQGRSSTGLPKLDEIT
jgi:HD superfamily phosphohydrolase